MSAEQKTIYGVLGFLWHYVTKASHFLYPLVKALEGLFKYSAGFGNRVLYAWSGAKTNKDDGYLIRLRVGSAEIYDRPVTVSSANIGSFVIGQKASSPGCLLLCAPPAGVQAIKTSPTGQVYLLNIDFTIQACGIFFYHPFSELGFSGDTIYDKISKTASVVYTLWCVVRLPADIFGLSSILGNPLPKESQEVLWRMYTEGATTYDVREMFGRAVGKTTATVSGLVSSVWVEGSYRFVLIGERLHWAPAEFSAVVAAGDTVNKGDSLFTIVDMVDYKDASRLSLGTLYVPVGGDVVAVPNASVPVVSVGDRRILQLSLLSGTDYVLEETVRGAGKKSVVAPYVTAVNALQYLWSNVWRDRLTVAQITGPRTRAQAEAMTDTVKAVRDVVNPGQAVVVVQTVQVDDTCESSSQVVGEAGYCTSGSDVVNLTIRVSNGPSMFI